MHIVKRQHISEYQKNVSHFNLFVHLIEYDTNRKGLSSSFHAVSTDKIVYFHPYDKIHGTK